MEDDGLSLSGDSPKEWTWDEVASLTYPTSFSVRVKSVDGESVDIGFVKSSDQRAFHRTITPDLQDRQGPVPEVEERDLPRRPSGIPLVSTPSIPGFSWKPVGYITASTVMSRNTFSDFGSDVKSAFGGNLEGIERAIDRAITETKSRLQTAGNELGAAAVIGVDLSIESVSDKAEAIVMSGTAVTLTSDRAALEPNSGHGG